MKCPYCGGEMTAGRLMADGRSGADLYWMPEGEKAPVFLTREKVEKRRGVVFGLLAGSHNLEAHCCADCKKLMVSYE